MITTSQAGAPCWLDIGSPDIGASVAFYQSVFGWGAEPIGEYPGDAHVLTKGGKTVGVVGPLDEGAQSGWTLYFNTTDAETTVKAVEQAGGTVRVPPFEGLDEQPMAQLTDPTGGEFAIWQGGDSDSAITVTEPGTLIWCELYTTDGPAAKDFYSSVLGWSVNDTAMPGEELSSDEPSMVYSLVTAEGGDQEDAQGGIMEMSAQELPGGQAYWHPVFHVTDCDAAVAAVGESGGTVQMGPVDAPGVGRLATCLDPFGASFVLLTPNPAG